MIEPAELVGARYPHLGRGYELAESEARTGSPSSRLDYPQPGLELDLTAAEGPTVSASRLETLGACPLRYFFRYVLELEPPEELAIDPERLARPAGPRLALARGVRTVLKDWSSEAPFPTPAATRHASGRFWTADRAIPSEIPPPTEAVFRREVSRLRRTARIFLREEEEYCRETGNRPLFLEVSIGMKVDGDAQPPSIPRAGRDQASRWRFAASSRADRSR